MIRPPWISVCLFFMLLILRHFAHCQFVFMEETKMRCISWIDQLIGPTDKTTNYLYLHGQEILLCSI